MGPGLLLDALAGTAAPDAVQTAWQAEAHDARWSALWLRAALAVAYAHAGSPAQAEHELAAALEAGERYPLFGTLVRRLAAEAAIQTRFADPVVLLRDAEAGYAALGLRRGTAAVRAMLASVGQASPRRRTGDPPVDDRLRRAGVTPREAEVLELLADRLTNRQIAARLYVSPKTVEKHVASLAAKLGAADRIELAALARG